MKSLVDMTADEIKEHREADRPTYCVTMVKYTNHFPFKLIYADIEDTTKQHVLDTINRCFSAKWRVHELTHWPPD